MGWFAIAQAAIAIVTLLSLPFIWRTDRRHPYFFLAIGAVLASTLVDSVAMRFAESLRPASHGLRIVLLALGFVFLFCHARASRATAPRD